MVAMPLCAASEDCTGVGVVLAFTAVVLAAVEVTVVAGAPVVLPVETEAALADDTGVAEDEAVLVVAVETCSVTVDVARVDAALVEVVAPEAGAEPPQEASAMLAIPTPRSPSTCRRLLVMRISPLARWAVRSDRSIGTASHHVNSMPDRRPGRCALAYSLALPGDSA
jgi:hypothetical protein